MHARCAAFGRSAIINPLKRMIEENNSVRESGATETNFGTAQQQSSNFVWRGYEPHLLQYSLVRSNQPRAVLLPRTSLSYSVFSHLSPRRRRKNSSMAASSPSFSLTASSPLYLLFLRRSSFTNRTRRRYRIKIWFVLKGRGARGRVGSKGHLPSSLNELSLPGRKENALRVFFARCPGLFQGRREQKASVLMLLGAATSRGPPVLTLEYPTPPP